MSKRFTDTDKWKKSFIRGLEARYKLLWLYILDDCDIAGVWQVDFEVASIKIGEEIDEKEALELFDGRVRSFDHGKKWFIMDYILFQYSELSTKNKMHQAVIKILKANNIDFPLESESGKTEEGPLSGASKGLTGPQIQGQGKGYGQGKEQVYGQGKERPKEKNEIPAETDLAEYELWTQAIIDNSDPTWEPMFMNSQVRLPLGKYIGLVEAHLSLLARYPKMRPQTQQAFRHSLLGYIKENKDKQVANGAVKGSNANKTTNHTASLIDDFKKRHGGSTGGG
jgi:hypothetical protein